MKDWRIYAPKLKDKKKVYKREISVQTIYYNIKKDDKDDTNLIPWQEKVNYEQLDIPTNQKFTAYDFNVWYDIQVEFIKKIRGRIDDMNNVIKFIYDAYRI